MTVTQDAERDWKDVELFGGAITAKIPVRFGDISDVRPVPDHQEVWGDPATNQSIIVEVTEHSAVPDAEAGRFVFDDLVTANDASSGSITTTQQLGAADLPHIPAGTYAVLVSGTIKACKGRDAAEHANNVLLLLAVLRFPQHTTDLLLTVNAPLFVSEGSSAGIQGGEQPAAQGQAAGLMLGVLRSLKVEDWGLFGG